MQNQPITYDYVSFSLPTGQSDYNVKTNQTSLFSNVKTASRVVIYSTQPISVKFNNTIMPAITLSLDRIPLQLPADFLLVANIFLTNTSGQTATVDIWLV